jgi:hypothetical protein
MKSKSGPSSSSDHGPEDSRRNSTQTTPFEMLLPLPMSSGDERSRTSSYQSGARGQIGVDTLPGVVLGGALSGFLDSLDVDEADQESMVGFISCSSWSDLG